MFLIATLGVPTFWHTNYQRYTHNGNPHAPPENLPEQIRV